MKHTQGVVLCCILNAKCLCETIAKVVSGSGRACFSVMHQGLDGCR